MKNKILIDELIKKGAYLNVEQEISKDIDISREWEKFNERYFQKRSRPVQRAIALLIIPFILSAAVFMNLLFPAQVKAINLKTLVFFKSFMVGKVQTVGIDYVNKNTEHKNIENLINPEIVKKLQSVPYKIFLPIDYLNKYQLETCDVQKFGDSIDVTLGLVAGDSYKVEIQQTNITQGFSDGLSFDNEDAVYKKVRINGQEATLVIYKKQIVSLTWIDADIYISMYGNVTEDEMLILASSMRRIP